MDYLWRDKISVLVTNPLLCFQSSVYGFFCSFGYQPNATKLHCAGYTATLAKFLHPPFGNAPFCCRFSARYIVHVRTCPFYLKSFGMVKNKTRQKPANAWVSLCLVAKRLANWGELLSGRPEVRLLSGTPNRAVYTARFLHLPARPGLCFCGAVCYTIFNRLQQEPAAPVGFDGNRGTVICNGSEKPEGSRGLRPGAPSQRSCIYCANTCCRRWLLI